MRGLSDVFINDLLGQEGVLHPILTKLRKDHTLMLAIRDGYINIYYRGGNILRVTEHNQGFYQTYFDENYKKSVKDIPFSSEIIKNIEDSRNWAASFPARKEIMDEYFSICSYSGR